mgnify:CR=1 FL=1
MSHVDVYDDPEKMWPLLAGGTITEANDAQMTVRTADGRTFEICPDAAGRFVLRINEVK